MIVMGTVHTLVMVAHVLIGAGIVGLVLLQRGKGAEAGAAFGAGASATVFGAKGSANFLSRSTAVLATLFFATSLTLAYMGGQRPVVKSVTEPATVTTPAPGGNEAAGGGAAAGPGAAGAPAEPAAPAAGGSESPPAGPAK